MWLYSLVEKGLLGEEAFAMGIELVLENKRGAQVQGQYETVDADHLVVRSGEAGAVRGIVIEQTYDHGNLVSAVWEQDGQELKSVRYNPDGTRAEFNSTQFGRLSIQYETRFHKSSVCTLANVGTLIVTYNADGEIVKTESTPPSAASTVARTLNSYLDLFSDW
jgi:hypothetical protein